MLIALTSAGLLGRALLYLYNDQYVPFSNFHTISCLDSLGIGGILAYLSIHRTEYLKKILSNKWFFGISVTLFFASMLLTFSMYKDAAKFNFGSMVFMRFFFNLMSFWVLGWAITYTYKGLIKVILENKVILYLGKISYGMYLYHLFVPQLWTILLNHFKITFLTEDTIAVYWIKIIVYILTTIGIASLSWFVIEKPINNIKRFISYNKKPSLVALKQR